MTDDTTHPEQRRTIVLHVSGQVRSAIGLHLLDLVHGLHHQALRSVVAAPEQVREDGYVSEEALYERIDVRPGVRAGVAAWARIRALTGVAKPDIVHAHGLTAGFLCGLGLKGVRGRPPLVVSVYDVAERPQRLEALVPRLANVTLAVSEELARRLRGFAPKADVRVVGLGIPPSRLQTRRGRKRMREELRTGQDRKVVVTLARLEPQKDLATLLQAAALTDGVRYWIAGVGPLRDQLQKQAEQLGVDNRVSFLGYRHDAADLLAAADCFALSSRWEGVPFSVIEAAAMGTPVVATRVGGVPEVIVDGESGWLVEPGDPEALAAAIQECLSSPPEAAARAARAREAVAGRLDPSRSLHQILDVYRELIARRP